ncbi:11353_t:CDS:2 [Acaulospora morrowiae]|uniref:Mannosyltransferase n=1 Tax=Acaulospora morrowiae TaxID=94023 RepID=A0A9N9G4E1_9GLOM|nr:11353_t:CDS:2 [Acaulospora morrowiae]
MSREQHTAELRSRHARSSSNTGGNSETRSTRSSSSHTSPKASNKSSARRAFFLFLIVRLSAAFFSNIADCDEVFNYWEPTHYLQYGYGMQTWEYSPEYAIRSWAYIKLHSIIGNIFDYIFGHDKIKVFYAIRVMFATLCAISEALFYVSAVSNLGPRVGRYLIVTMLFSAGMWNASTAFLPSTFAMYTTMIAFFYALRPVSTASRSRIYKTIFWIGIGSLLAWPFCAEVGIPAALEELVLRTNGAKKFERIKRLLLGTIISTGIILIPLVLVDYYYYKQLNVVPWNIIAYNMFGGKDRGPNLYGTEPWYYYVMNGLLNFNILFIMALISLPGLLVTSVVDSGRISSSTTTGPVYAYLYLIFRLMPFYLWFFTFLAQPHKEERFLFVVYPLLCLNAAVAMFLVRGWFDQLLVFLSDGNMPYMSTRRSYMKIFTISILIVAGFISILRVEALYFHYNAPMAVYNHFYYVEIPQQIETHNIQPNLDNPINLCVGKEWYRFPSHYFLPDGVRLRFLKSDFSGQLPKYFLENNYTDSEGKTKLSSERDGIWKIPEGFNNVNKEEMDRYVNIEQCDYIVDLEMNYTDTSIHEPRYVTQTDQWNEVICKPFLDTANSERFSRAFFLPPELWQSVKSIIRYLPARMVNNDAIDRLGTLKWGDYCLMRRKHGRK